jgi:hypothetical protein
MAIFLDVLDLPEPLGPSSATTIISRANLPILHQCNQRILLREGK